MITVQVLGENTKKEVRGNIKGYDLIKEFGLALDSTIIMKNGKPVPEDEVIEDGSEITLIRSFSGG